MSLGSDSAAAEGQETRAGQQKNHFAHLQGHFQDTADSKVPSSHLCCGKPLLVSKNLQNDFSYPEG